MTTPLWVKPGLVGAAAGALAITVIGFSWGGWVTNSKAMEMASVSAHQQVVDALVPVCIEKSKQDPQMADVLLQWKDAGSYQRREILMKAGWATMPGSTEPNRPVASACVEQLASRL